MDLFKNFWLFKDYGWAVSAFGVIFIALLVAYFEKRIYRKILPIAEKSPRFWDDALIKAMHNPVVLAIWVFGITFAAQLGVRYAVENSILGEILAPLRKLATSVIIVWFLIRFIREIEANITRSHLKKTKWDETTLRAVSQIFRVSIFITAALVLSQSLGIPITGVLALGGFGGIAIGFAAKDLLANFFGGLMIFLDRPFKIGDWIRSPDKEIEGMVENIGLRLTRIRTFDKRPLFVPNSLFSSISIENPSRMMNRRIKETIGLRYEDGPKMEVILKDIEKMLKNHPEIDPYKVCFVALVHFGHSALEFMVYAFTKTTDWVSFQMIQQDVFLKILQIIEKHKASCAFPTTTLHIPEGIELKSTQA